MAPPKKTQYSRDMEAAKSLALAYDLTDLDKFVLAKVVNFPAIKGPELAVAANVSVAQIRKIRAKPAFKRAYDDLQQTSEEVLKKAAEKAARRLRELIDSKDQKIALEAIKLALGPVLNKSQVDVSIKPQIVFKTTVEPDGSLLQRTMEKLVGG